nr:hypothetical protein [Tanacetum cinerariifolium]
ITEIGTKPVAVTPKNQNQQVRRTLQITKSGKPFVDTSTSPNINSNTPVLSSTRVALASSASGSQSKDTTKKNKIRRTLKKAKETKLEDHPRKVKSSMIKTKASSSVIKSVSHVNANLKCASCNGCLFADNHDKCVVEYINSMNVCRKSKSAKTPVNRKVWKTTGKVFKTVGYKWIPTRRIFTLVGNVCPLTRIATAPFVPRREPILIVQSIDKPVVTLVYTRKPRAKHSVEVADLNASLQERVLVITALKEQLKGKAVLSKAVSLNPIDPAILQVDALPLVPKLRKNRTAHIDYLKHTLEEAATLRELVESERLLSPLNTP